MKDGQPVTVERAAYAAPSHWIDTIDLRVELDPTATRVHAELQVRRNLETPAVNLRLDGVDLELLEVSVDGRVLAGNEYQVDGSGMTLFGLPDACRIRCTTRISPATNTSLEGLYQSNGMFCTQCEAEGFRKITYYLDRPDVMARFRTTVVADGVEFPVLLSNGNAVAREELADGRVAVTWEDPYPKPAYLFALVAGDLALLEGSFRTQSGRDVRLCIYSEPHNIGQCDYAMLALQRAMRWDEVRFGREYDLDIFMIVAVDHFNMGAMENKGLNVFNTNCVLARADTTTDDGFLRVEAVIGHEYFHNWSGNRVTCRDWFQLSLKEGFTVYRDQEFSADLGHRALKRIEDVERLRTTQFPEDAGPMAHPIRPDSYMEISNFYTPTVYEKGAEVVRMLATLLGDDGFRKGSDLYFERHDGQAATCEDFVCAMEDANAVALLQFRNWYSQSGTPVLAIETSFDAAAQCCRLEIRQLRALERAGSVATDPVQLPPLHIPLGIGVLDQTGRELRVVGASAPGASSHDGVQIGGGQLPVLINDATAILQLSAAIEVFELRGLSAAPVISLQRAFSAPVKIEYSRSLAELALLMLHDSDGFSRWDAAQQFYFQVLERHIREQVIEPSLVPVVQALLQAVRTLAGAHGSTEDGERQAIIAAMLTLPSEQFLCEQFDPMPIDAVHAAHEAVLQHLANELAADWQAVYTLRSPAHAYRPEPADMARRSLRNVCLTYMARENSHAARERLQLQFDGADNMTDRLAALRAIVDHPHAAGDAFRTRALAQFLADFRQEALVMDLWLSVQATSSRPRAHERIVALAQHPVFDVAVPNKVRALYSAFAQRNPVNFHAADGSGYQLIADAVRALDARNPQVAARLAKSLSVWRRLPAARAALLRGQLEALAELPALSPDVFEVVTKSLSTRVLLA